MKKLMVAATVTLCLGLSGFAKEIAVNATETITEDTSLDEDLFVKGTLNIVGATLTMQNSHTITVGGSGTAGKLNVTNGKIVMKITSGGASIQIGKDGGTADVFLDNSSVDARILQMAYNDEWPRATLTLTNNSTIALQGGLTLNQSRAGHMAAPQNTLQSWIRLCEGCRINAPILVGEDNMRCGIYFAGGTLAVAYVQAKDACKLFLKGVDGHSVKIECNPNTWWPSTSLFVFSSADARILLGAESPTDLTPVDCAFVKSGAFSGTLVEASSASQLLMAYAGGTRILSGGIQLTASDQLPIGGDVHVEGAAALQFDGFSQKFGSFTGGGSVKNDSETPVQITLDVRAGETKVYSANAGSNISIAKTGDGKLIAQKNVFGGVTVQGGTVEFADPSEIGYHEYRFKVDRPYGDTYSGMSFAELDFYNGDENVTTPYEMISGGDANLFDHNSNTYWWVTCRYDTNPIGDRGIVDVRYPETKKLTSYTWTTHINAPPSDSWCVDPGAWSFYGRFLGGKWVELGRMVNKGYALQTRSTETEKFPVTYPQMTSVSIGGTVFSGGSIVLDGDVALEIPFGETFTATGSDVVFSALALDCAMKGGTIVGGTVAAEGKLWLTGVDSGAVKSGTVLPLTFDGTAKTVGESRWSIYVDGVLDPKHWAVFADGKFMVSGPGLVLIFR